MFFTALLRGEVFLPSCCVENSPPWHWHPSLWAQSPRRCAWSPPSGPHCRRHFVSDEAFGLNGRPSPLQGEGFLLLPRCCPESSLPVVGACPRWHHFLTGVHGVRRAAVTAVTIILRRSGRRAQQAALPPQRRVFTELMLGEFAFPLLAPFFVGAISSPLIRESAVLSSSLPRLRGCHLLATKRGVRRAAAIAAAMILAPMRPPDSTDSSPSQGDKLLPSCSARSSPPRCWRPSSSAPFPRHCAWIPPSGPHRCRNILGPMRPPDSTGGPPPSGRGSLTRRCAGSSPPRPWHPSSWAPSPRRCTWSPLSVHHRRLHNLTPMRPP